MKKFLFSSIVFSLLLVTSCKKEDPKPASGQLVGTPEFSLQGEIGGDVIGIQAGANNYFMSTSYSLGDDGIYSFIGELKEKNCDTDCGNALKISIKDYRQFSAFATTKDSSIIAGYYAFETPEGESSAYSAIFIGGLDKNNETKYTWDFGDGNSSVETSSTFSHQYSHPGIYSVSLTAESQSGCSSTITNNVICGQTGGQFSSHFTESVSGDVADFISIPIGGIPPYTYAWDFGDGTTSTESRPSHIYDAPGVYLASLKVVDILGVEGMIQYSNVSINTTSECSSYFIIPSPSSIDNPLNLSTVEVEWTDSEGTVWTSNNDNQSSRSSFQIVSVVDYIDNSEGESTKKITVKVSCTLYNGFQILKMEDVEMDFAVACK